MKKILLLATLAAFTLLACNGGSGDIPPDDQKELCKEVTQKVNIGASETSFEVDTKAYTANCDSTDIQLRWSSLVLTSDTNATKVIEKAKADSVLAMY